MYLVILFAAIAAFLALRLYSVLGKRTGHEQPLPKPAEERIGGPQMPRTIDMPADVYRNLTAYAEAHAAQTGQASQGPAKLIVPMLAQFMAADREFAKIKQAAR